jgi:hypothetical protein
MEQGARSDLAASDGTAEAGSVPMSRVFSLLPIRTDPHSTRARLGRYRRARHRAISVAPTLKLLLDQYSVYGTRRGESL